jgi:hypothetical protein
MKPSPVKLARAAVAATEAAVAVVAAAVVMVVAAAVVVIDRPPERWNGCLVTQTPFLS